MVRAWNIVGSPLRRRARLPGDLKGVGEFYPRASPFGIEADAPGR